ncbi:TetR/AcrR family transcriptional regulator [Microbacterium sp. RG1]|nr:TetR/AcrR family transcriptional regulator [Microbacterium sp. RG1]
MGRTRTFDEDAVVRAARDVFWQHGYAEASVPDLEAATGLGRSSLYHSFGSKRELFDAAIESYLDEVIRPRLAPLLGAPVSADALETYLTGLAAALQAPRTHLAEHGCLLMNTVRGTLADDEHVKRAVGQYRAELTTAFAAGVAARRPDLDAEDRTVLTRSCTAHVLSAMAIVRAQPAAAADLVENARILVTGWAPR